ncbi:hypothetical protein, partial [Nostoc sp.]|uniref:hypothetical protein n=1 Tax=Nostoc sp. TaxID=1180 RepID=UPI002FFC403C
SVYILRQVLVHICDTPPQVSPLSILCHLNPYRLRLDKGIESFERRTIDVELEVITTSQVMSKFISAVVPTSEAEL